MGEHIVRMEKLWEFANHVKRHLTVDKECIQCVDELINSMEIYKVIGEYVRELNGYDVPRHIRNSFVANLYNVEWRYNQFKTDKWKNNICKKVQSMIRVDDWFM